MDDGQIEDIPQNWSIKQGCLLSTLIFILTIESLLSGIATAPCSGYQFTDSLELRCMAYADDLVIVTSSEGNIGHTITRVLNFCWHPVQCGGVCSEQLYAPLHHMTSDLAFGKLVIFSS